MQDILEGLFNQTDLKAIELAHQLQTQVFGVCKPPTLKQLINLRYFLVTKGLVEEIAPNQLLGLSNVQCRILLKKLKKFPG